jgi:hypothetical protein
MRISSRETCRRGSGGSASAQQRPVASDQPLHAPAGEFTETADRSQSAFSPRLAKRNPTACGIALRTCESRVAPTVPGRNLLACRDRSVGRNVDDQENY